jgi:hypothetical protein
MIKDKNYLFKDEPEPDPTFVPQLLQATLV